jgi:glycosyltransferase involved in cell wall biosynthesis
MLLTSPCSIYACFDRFPTRKGASTHIARFAPCLFDYAGGGLLYCLGDSALPVHQVEGNVEILRFARPVSNFLERALAYGVELGRVLARDGQRLELAQFRDPWSGVPLLTHAPHCPALYEVNALPSIELAQVFPSLPARTIEKIHADERLCLDLCAGIVTPSETTRRLLRSLGVPAEKITVIPNGADLCEVAPRPLAAPSEYLIYFGAMQRWQGVDTLLRAFARLADLDTLRLVLCASERTRDTRRLERFAERLGLSPRVEWRYRLPAEELSAWLQHAVLSVAPLQDCARNVLQGCAPLKILESMACGVPVIASDLAPVRELIRDGVNGRLVAADRPGELARTIRVLLAYPEHRATLGRNARERIARELTWEIATERLTALYRRFAGVAPDLHPHVAPALAGSLGG